MHPRLILALGVGGLAAVCAMVFGAWKQVGVKSYGHPAGRVVRAGQHLCVLIETCDPYMPSLRGRSESDMRYSYALWVIGEAGDAGRSIGLAQGVRSSERTHNIGAQWFENGVLWYTIGDLKGMDVASGRASSQAPPAALVNAPISQLMGTGGNPLEDFRSQSVTLATGERLVLANEDELSRNMKPGTRLYDNPTAEGTYKPRSLHTVTAQPGPIARIAEVKPLGSRPFRNGAFMRGTAGGDVVKFTNPDGFLVVHEGGDVVHPTVCLSRVSSDGTVVWTADTTIGRLTQVLPHGRLPAFVGELPQQLTEPLLAVVHLKDGTVRTKSLKGPLN